MRLALALSAALFVLPAGSQAAEQWHDRRASDLIGAKAVDRSGNELGRIADLIVATRTGFVHYAVVSFSGWLRLSGEQYLFPINALIPGPQGAVAIQVDLSDLGERTGVEELERWLLRYDAEATAARNRFTSVRKHVAPADLVVDLDSGLTRCVVRSGPDA